MGPRSSGSSKRGGAGSSSRDSDGNDSDYQHRREQNNIAVRRSREKSRARAKLTAERVAALRRENGELEGKIGLLAKELGLLKELLVTRAGRKTLSNASAAVADGANDELNDARGRAAGRTVGTVAADPNLVQQDHGYNLVQRKYSAK